MRNNGQSSATTEQEQPIKDGVGWLRLFGDPCFCWQGTPHRLARRQPQALLYYLALQERPATRQTLCQLFWPEAPVIDAQRRLTHVLDDLKRSLPARDLLERSKETVKLNTTKLAIDTNTFLALTVPEASILALLQATAFYHAPLLSNFDLPHHPTFELWLLGERATWETLYLAVLARLVTQQTAAGQWQGAISHALHYLYSNVTDETMHRTLIELYGRLGDRDAAQHHYRWCVSVLAREMGAQPTPATEAAYRATLNQRGYL